MIYIGKVNNTYTRLSIIATAYSYLLKQNGIADDEPWVSSKYQYMYHNGAKVYYYKCLGKQDAKELETRVMWAFYSNHRTLPVGNGAKSYSKE